MQGQVQLALETWRRKCTERREGWGKERESKRHKDRERERTKERERSCEQELLIDGPWLAYITRYLG